MPKIRDERYSWSDGALPGGCLLKEAHMRAEDVAPLWKTVLVESVIREIKSRKQCTVRKLYTMVVGMKHCFDSGWHCLCFSAELQKLEGSVHSLVWKTVLIVGLPGDVLDELTHDQACARVWSGISFSRTFCRVSWNDFVGEFGNKNVNYLFRWELSFCLKWIKSFNSDFQILWQNKSNAKNKGPQSIKFIFPFDNA